jgi:hypothetical protein
MKFKKIDVSIIDQKNLVLMNEYTFEDKIQNYETREYWGGYTGVHKPCYGPGV